MKQFQYTACRTGHSVSGRSGFQVRAVTLGLSDALLTALTSAARYELPPGLPGDTPPAQAPRRLAVVALPDGGRAVVHSAHIGADPETKRMGNFFSHAVAGTAAEVDPLAALRTWGGRFWATADGDGPTALPEVPADRALAPAGVLTDAARQQTVRDHRPVVEFLLTNLLTDAAVRLFVMAPPDVVARALDVALSVLPPSARAGVTFSTYEPPGDLVTSRPRVVGTWAAAAGVEMDDQCYGGVGLGFNPGSGKKSPLPPAPEFVGFALDALAAGQSARLAAVDADMRKRQPTDGPGVALLYRLLHGSALPTEDELARPEAVALADGIAARDGIAPTLAAAAAAGRLPPAYAAALARQPQTRRQVTEKLWELGLKAAREGRAADMRAAWAALIPLGPGFDPGRRLLETGTDPRPLPLPVRRELLPAVLAAGRGNPDATAAWLVARANELADLLPAIPDRADRVRVVAGCVKTDPAGAKPAAAAVASDPPLALDVGYEVKLAGKEAVGAAPLGRGQSDARSGEKPAKPVWRTFVAEAVASKHAADWFASILHWVRESGVKDADYLDACLTEAIAGQDQLDPDAPVKYGDWLFTSFPRGESWVRLARRVLDQMPGWVGRDDLRAYLKKVAQGAPKDREGDDIRRRVNAGVEIDDFCRAPKFDPPVLLAVGATLAALPADDPRSLGRRALAWAAPRVFDRGGSERKVKTDAVLGAVVNAWLSRGERDWPRTRAEFEAVVEHLGATREGRARLYADLWRRAGRALYDNGGLLYAVLVVGGLKPNSKELDSLFSDRQRAAHVRALAARYATGRRAWVYVDQHVGRPWRPAADDGSVWSKLRRDVKYYTDRGFYLLLGLILFAALFYGFNHKWIDQKSVIWFGPRPKDAPDDDAPPAPVGPDEKEKKPGKAAPVELDPKGKAAGKAAPAVPDDKGKAAPAVPGEKEKTAGKAETSDGKGGK